MAKKDTDKIDWLMTFPRYRRLVKAHNTAIDMNADLRKNWKEQIIVNDNLKDKIKKQNKLIYKLRKELKNEKGNKGQKI